jgi:ATP-dependent exoDNAse (exonuclease V) beta subunit
MVQEPFDQKGVAQKTFEKRFNDPESEYYQMTVEQIIEKWQLKGQISLQYGRLNDNYIGIVLEGTEDDKDLFYLDNDVDGDERLNTQVRAFDEFMNDLPEHIVFVAREITLYYKIGEHYVKGRFDALFYDTIKNKWIVVDWKTSGTVDTKPTRYTTKLLGPARVFDALNWNTYTMQVYFYKTALVESGYLPEGTTFDDIDVCIVNFPGREFEDGKLYKKYPKAFDYDKDQMDGIFTFGIKKNILLNKKNGSNN